MSEISPLSNFDIENEARKLKIKHWRGVFMRDQLPSRLRKRERAVINLDRTSGSGTHWTCYDVSPEKILYFDSYGLPPPRELVEYLGNSSNFSYNTFKLQGINSRGISPPICGHLCLIMLKKLSDGEDFLSILLEMKKSTF